MDFNQLESLIQTIENKQKISRKASLNDINCSQENIYEIHNSEKIKTYRKQGEYGEKKFIKP